MKYPPQYVLDEMEWYEVRAAMKYQYYAHKDEWESSRLIAYLIAQTNSRKKLSLNDIVKFYWEKDEDEEDISIINKEDIERLKKEAEKYTKQ